MLTILCGDALDKLRELPDESLQCCVTSPPYWGLRDYGTASWEGGDESYDHIERTGRNDVTPEALARRAELYGTGQQNGSKVSPIQFSYACGKCGSKRIDSQLGLEKTPEEYVAKIVEVFHEVRRVLRKDGTLWLNLGDSMVGGNNTNNGGNANFGSQPGREGMGYTAKSEWKGLRPKNLIGIPWRVAFALQADGWYLRQDIIWAKPNPMPESVTDRCTKSHEYLFLLTKASRYFYDTEAIKEQSSESYRNDGRWETGPTEENEKNGYELAGARNPKRVHSVFNGERKTTVNKRSVWTVPTAPYPDAHFATYPPDLIKPCVMAGSRVGDTILDPFAGSGTTGAVAIELGRKAILIELNPKYVELIKERCDITPGLALA